MLPNAPNISSEERFHFGLADPAKNHNAWISWDRLEKKKHHVIALAQFSVIKCHLVLTYVICFLIPSTWTKDSLTQRDYQLWLVNLGVCFPPKKLLKGSLTAIAQACPGALWMHGRPDVRTVRSVAWCFCPESQDGNKTK